jgi:hypothetical protein
MAGADDHHPAPGVPVAPAPLPRLRSSLLAVFVDGELVVVEPGSRATHVLAGPALAVWASLELHGGESVHLADALTSVVADTVHLDRSETEAEAARVLAEFQRLGLLQHEPS